MNILLVQPTTAYLIMLTAVILVITILLFILGHRKKKPKVSPISLDFLDQLYLALGGVTNILSVSREHQRLQVKVNQMKSVDANKLQELKTPAFVKGKEITLLIKNHTQEVLSYLNGRRKEDS